MHNGCQIGPEALIESTGYHSTELCGHFCQWTNQRAWDTFPTDRSLVVEEEGSASPTLSDLLIRLWRNTSSKVVKAERLVK